MVRSTEVRITIRTTILECLPAIVGTGFFLTGVLASKLHQWNAPPVIFRSPTYVERVGDAAFLTLYTAVYLGAALGPLALPFAAYEAVRLTRMEGVRSTAAIWAWTFVALGVIAAALFWGWVITLDIFV